MVEDLAKMFKSGRLSVTNEIALKVGINLGRDQTVRWNHPIFN